MTRPIEIYFGPVLLGMVPGGSLPSARLRGAGRGGTVRRVHHPGARQATVRGPWPRLAPELPAR